MIRYPFSRSALLPLHIFGLLSLFALGGCGDGGTEPTLTEPGFILSVSIPGLTDTTIQGDSLYWRHFSRPHPIGSPEVHQVTLEMLILDPPPPLASPLVFQVHWLRLSTPLLDARTYPLSLDPPVDVVLEVNSNFGTWAASQGQLKLAEVTDTSLSGTLTATMVPVYPPGSTLPSIRVRGSFWAPRATPLLTGN